MYTTYNLPRYNPSPKVVGFDSHQLGLKLGRLFHLTVDAVLGTQVCPLPSCFVAHVLCSVCFPRRSETVNGPHVSTPPSRGHDAGSNEQKSSSGYTAASFCPFG